MTCIKKFFQSLLLIFIKAAELNFMVHCIYFFHRGELLCQLLRRIGGVLHNTVMHKKRCHSHCKTVSRVNLCLLPSEELTIAVCPHQMSANNDIPGCKYKADDEQHQHDTVHTIILQQYCRNS